MYLRIQSLVKLLPEDVWRDGRSGVDRQQSRKGREGGGSCSKLTDKYLSTWVGLLRLLESLWEGGEGVGFR